MVVLRQTVLLLILVGPALACGPALKQDPLGDVNDIFETRPPPPILSGQPLTVVAPVHSVAAPTPGSADPDDLLGEDDILVVEERSEIDDLLEPAPDTSHPPQLSWQLPVRDAMAFKTWPVDLDQGREDHRKAMDLVERSIIPLQSGWFRPGVRVTRIQLLDWLSQVEDWVRIGQTGLSLDTKLTLAKRSTPIVTLLRLGLVSADRRLDGESWVDRAFELRVLDGLERSWGTAVLAGRPRLTRSFEPDRVEVAVWLRDIAEELCHSGQQPTFKADPRSVAHLTVLLSLMEDGSPRVRELAHRALADADAAVVATLLVGRKEEWFRDPVVLETLPETAVKLGLASGDIAAGQFREVMRILRGLKDSGLEVRFVRAAHEAIAKLPQDKPLPPRLLSEMVGVLVSRGWTEQLDTLLQWGMPALEAVVPYLEQEAIDRHWSERMPYSLEPGWDQRGQGVVAQLKVLVKNPRIPAGTRASALDRLDRLGEGIPRDQMRTMGLTPDNDADAARARLARVAIRMLDRQSQPAAPQRRNLTEDQEVQKLAQMVRSYQLYLAIALGVIALIALAHLAIIIPMLIVRALRRLRTVLGLERVRREP